MKSFPIQGTKTETIDEEVKARNRIEAAKMFAFKYPKHNFDHVGDDMIIGWCENSEIPIFEGDEYHEDENGIMWLKN